MKVSGIDNDPIALRVGDTSIGLLIRFIEIHQVKHAPRYQLRKRMPQTNEPGVETSRSGTSAERGDPDSLAEDHAALT